MRRYVRYHITAARHFRSRVCKEMKSRHPCFLLAGGRIAIDAQEAVHTDLSFCDSRISHATQTANIIRLDGYIVLPGLINAHDHLEFGMFPRRGSGPYPNW